MRYASPMSFPRLPAVAAAFSESAGSRYAAASRRRRHVVGLFTSSP
jgi:hypothetical protein